MKLKICCAFVLSLLVMPVSADMQSFVRETQKTEVTHSAMKMIWWIPKEFWVESFKNNPRMTELQVKEFISVVDDYTMVAIVDVKFGPFASIESKKYEDIEKDLYLEVNDEKYFPIKKSNLKQDISNFFNSMKPIMSQGVGKFGEGMEFFVFDSKDKNGNRLLDPYKEMKFSFVTDKKYNYRLPLAALLPDKFDPVTKEIFPGNYKFNPFTGVTLR